MSRFRPGLLPKAGEKHPVWRTQYVFLGHGERLDTSHLETDEEVQERLQKKYLLYRLMKIGGSVFSVVRRQA